MNTDAPIKELTWDEQATWGTCAACGASHGEPCDPDIGWALGGVLPLAIEAINELLAEFDNTVTDAGFQVVALR